MMTGKNRRVFGLKAVLLLAVGGLGPILMDPATGFPGGGGTVGRSSSAVAVSADGRRVLAVNPDSDTVSVVDTASLKVTAEIRTGRSPRTVAVDARGKMAVTANRGDGTVSILDVDLKGEVGRVSVGDLPWGVVLTPDGRTAWVACEGSRRVAAVDLASHAVVASVTTGERPTGLALSADGSTLYVTDLLTGRVSVIDTAAGSLDAVLDTWSTANLSQSVVLSPDGGRLYLPQTRSNADNPALTFDSTVAPIVTVVDATTGQVVRSELISLAQADRPVGLPFDAAVLSDGETLMVVNAASNDVSVIDLAGSRRAVAHIAVGANPRGIAVSPDGARAFVDNTLDGTLSVIDTSSWTVDTTVSLTTIPMPPALLTGKRLFYSSARADLAKDHWISCASCHWEGEHDGRTWKFGFSGPRNTTSLRGMIATYPLRWSAQWDESADSEQAVRKEQFGTGLIDGEMNPTLGDPNQGRSLDLDCLAAYIDSLEPIPSHAPTGLAPQQVERGRELFFSAATECGSCHSEPYYTDHQRHDVGTATGSEERLGPEMDTPSLRGLASSAPYLHDGSAATLMDVLTTDNRPDLHGSTSGLSADELDDLVAFLLSIPRDAGASGSKPPVSMRPSSRQIEGGFATGGEVTPVEGPSISGRVVDAAGTPVARAVVSIRATTRRTLSSNDGRFLITPPASATSVEIAAWAPGSYIAHQSITPPVSGLELSLRDLSSRDNASYQWTDPRPEVGGSGACGNCHPKILQRWQNNAHARTISNHRFYSFYNGTDVAGSSTVSPGYLLDFPGTPGNCAACHAPAAAIDGPFSTNMNEQRDRLLSGIHCDFCHKTGSVYLKPSTKLPYPNMPGAFSLRTLRPPTGDDVFFGPYPDIDDPDTYAPQMTESEYCAPCHSFSFWGTPIYTSYTEWLASSYPDRNITCQSCHMPPSGDTYFVPPEHGGREHPAETIPSHKLLGITDAAFMQAAADVQVETELNSGELRVAVTVSNVGAGHDLPTGHPGRHLLLVLEAEDWDGTPLALLSGPTVPVWGGGLSGRPGKGFAKLLRDLVDGEMPVVSYWKQAVIDSDTRLPPEGRDESEYVFAAGTGPMTVNVRLLFRRLFEPIAERYGWSLDEVTLKEVSREVQSGQ